MKTQKPLCLLCGGVVPGWFLDGSAKHTLTTHVQNHFACRAAAWFLDGSWMVPGWFRQQTTTIHVKIQHCLLCDDVAQ